MDTPNSQPIKPSLRQKRPARKSAEENWFGKILDFLKLIAKKIGNFLAKIGRGVRGLWQSFLKSFAAWVDPKLEPYRVKPRANLEKVEVARDDLPAEVEVREEIYTPASPETRDDLFALLREAPMTVLTSGERKAMSAVLSLPDVQVVELMTPKAKMVFVDKYETLGPLVLDRLYKSGFTFFPVVDSNKHIIGTLQTTLLNSLDIKDTHQAKDVMDPRVYYIRADYSLEQALKAFVRTNSQLMLVVDHYEKLVGMLTFSHLLDYLFSENYRDDFDRDDDRLAVAKRKDSKKSFSSVI